MAYLLRRLRSLLHSDHERIHAGNASSSFQEEIYSWVLAELKEWSTLKISAAAACAALRDINLHNPQVALYQVAGNRVSLLAKPEEFSSRNLKSRARHYLDLLTDSLCVQNGHLTATTVVPIHLEDGAIEHPVIPIFCFQKPRGHRAILLPDIDFMGNDYYRSGIYTDHLGYEVKTLAAGFIGATTGGGIIDADKVRNAAFPRLRAFQYFRNHPDVSFKLPVITQCDGPETMALLEQLGCGGGKINSAWQQQFQKRFIISMDGNGATCARVVITLKSNSVLLKYNSDSMLYYFHGLQPWLHYLPVETDLDVEKLLELARRGISFAPVAKAGQQFANAFLTKHAVQTYTRQLLQMYATHVLPLTESQIAAHLK